MRFLLFAACIGCGGTIATGDDAAAGDAGADGPGDVFVDPGFRSSLAFEVVGHDALFYGVFYASAQAANGSCEQTTSGACVTYTCPSVSPQMGSSAGTLTLSINGMAIAKATPNAPDDTYFASVLAFSPGDVLGVSGSGADVPAFAMQTVKSPGKVTTNVPTAIDTSQDFTLAWSGGEPDATVIVGIARGVPNGSAGVSCTFDATAGTGTIPKALLATIQSGAPNGDVIVGQQRKTTFASGAFVTDLVAIQSDDSPVDFP